MFDPGATVGAKFKIHIYIVTDRPSLAEMLMQNDGNGVRDGRDQTAIAEYW